MRSAAYSSGGSSYLAGIRQQHSTAPANSSSTSSVMTSAFTTMSLTNGYGNGVVNSPTAVLNGGSGGGGNSWNNNNSTFSFNDVFRGGKVQSNLNEILGKVCPSYNNHLHHIHQSSTSGNGEEKFSRKVFVGGLPPDIDEVIDCQQQSMGSNDLYNLGGGTTVGGGGGAGQEVEGVAPTTYGLAPGTPRAIVKSCGYASLGGSVNASPMKSSTASFSSSSLSLSLSSLSLGSKQNSPARLANYQSAAFVGNGGPPGGANLMNLPTPVGYSQSVFTFNAQQQPSTPTARCFPQNFNPSNEMFSRKVFIGGLPIDISEDEINATFSKFGACFVDWPHKAESKSYFPPKGYAFLIFETEASVQSLIKACVHDGEKYFLHVSSPTIKGKAVQLRPWMLTDSDFYVDQTLQLDPRKTIFVGGVPRPLKATELARIMEQLYGGVCYAGIDTDPELKYPKGAGRVAFSNQQSYINAISGRFVQLHVADIPDKRAEVKPYVLDDQICDECSGRECNGKYAPFFCANVTCLSYYCENCWAKIHSRVGRENHKPLVKEGSDRPRIVPFKWV